MPAEKKLVLYSASCMPLSDSSLLHPQDISHLAPVNPQNLSAHVQSSPSHLYQSRIHPPLLRHNLSNGPPEIASHSPPTFPRIRIHDPERILRVRRNALPIDRVRTRRVEIELIRRSDRVDRPFAGIVRRGVVVCRNTVGDGVGDRRVVGRDEIAPDSLEGGREVHAEALAGVVEVSGKN